MLKLRALRDRRPGARMRALREFLKLAFALPLIQIINIAAYAKTRHDPLDRVATFISFLPVFVITTYRERQRSRLNGRG